MVDRPKSGLGLMPVDMAGTASSFLVKPVGAACNMCCRYCFYQPEKRGLEAGHGNGVMSSATLELMTSELLRLPGKFLSICWQGGEPTLAGLPFFKNAISLQKQFEGAKSISNSLQTNGTNLDNNWAEFLQKNHFLVGLSLDGPKEIHDAMRLDLNLKSVWRTTLDAAHRLQDLGVQVNILCCLTAYSVGHEVEIYQFFRNEGFQHIQFIPILETDFKDPYKVAPYSLAADDYGTILCNLWDLWLKDLECGEALGVRYFESFCHRAFGQAPTLCEMYPICNDYAVIEFDGSVYPCDFFVTGHWRLGTLENGLLEVLTSPHARHFQEIRLMLQPQCRSCHWLPFCYGGCLKYRRVANHLSGHTLYCSSYKCFFEHAYPQITKVAARLMQSHSNRYVNASKMS